MKLKNLPEDKIIADSRFCNFHFSYTFALLKSGCSSFGRARPCQGRGGRFEPGHPLTLKLFVERYFPHT
jgi:hypothetical protein